MRFRALPAAGSPARVRLAIGTCATEFATMFPRIAARRPDVLVWHGDVGYPDRLGPLAQTHAGYAGWWRAILSGARDLLPLLRTSCFCPNRDDHDYGRNNVGAEQGIPDYGIVPWEAIMSPRPWYSFRGGLFQAWVLDQRRFRDAPALPDTSDKSLLGRRQRRWLFEGLAASRAPFKIVCSPCPLYYPTNADPGSWGAAYQAERDALLRHIRRNVSGRTIFVTGDTHSGAVVRFPGFLEIRAAPLDIPINEAPPSEGDGVVFSARGRYVAYADVHAVGGRPTLDLELVDQDGRTRFAERLQTRRGAVAPSRRCRPRRRQSRARGRRLPRYTG